MSVERVAGVGLDDVFRKDGKLYRVVGITDRPTVELEAVAAILPARVNLVIGSPLFDEYQHLVPKEETHERP